MPRSTRRPSPSRCFRPGCAPLDRIALSARARPLQGGALRRGRPRAHRRLGAPAPTPGAASTSPARRSKIRKPTAPPPRSTPRPPRSVSIRDPPRCPARRGAPADQRAVVPGDLARAESILTELGQIGAPLVGVRARPGAEALLVHAQLAERRGQGLPPPSSIERNLGPSIRSPRRPRPRKSAGSARARGDHPEGSGRSRGALAHRRPQRPGHRRPLTPLAAAPEAQAPQSRGLRGPLRAREGPEEAAPARRRPEGVRKRARGLRRAGRLRPSRAPSTSRGRAQR